MLDSCLPALRPSVEVPGTYVVHTLMLCLCLIVVLLPALRPSVRVPGTYAVHTLMLCLIVVLLPALRTGTYVLCSKYLDVFVFDSCTVAGPAS